MAAGATLLIGQGDRFDNGGGADGLGPLSLWLRQSTNTNVLDGPQATGQGDWPDDDYDDAGSSGPLFQVTMTPAKH